MVKRCMETRTPFGVINISAGQLATIGTIADIREATRYVDGRWDLVTFGTRRFRVLRLDREAPYLRAEIELLDEPLGAGDVELKQRADQVSNAFVAYLNLIRGADEVEIELEGFDEDDDDDEDGASDSSDEVTLEAIDEALSEEEGPRLSEEVVYQIERLLLSSNAIWEADGLSGGGELEGDSEEDEEEHLLEAAITQLSGSDDPTALSHIIGGVVHLSTPERQSLLEAPDTASRLITLRQHLDRELLLLHEGFHPWSAPPTALGDRRN
jgi:Lon protease-like protein